MVSQGWNPSERDMSVVVQIHNAVNERAWAHVLHWEQLHARSCNCPKLLKFRGRPNDYSPRAMLLNTLVRICFCTCFCSVNHDVNHMHTQHVLCAHLRVVRGPHASSPSGSCANQYSMFALSEAAWLHPMDACNSVQGGKLETMRPYSAW